MNSPPATKRRPKSTEQEDIFNKMCQWVEFEAELYTLEELHTKMVELGGRVDVYTKKWTEKKLIEKYKDFIFFTEIDGKSNVVCFKNIASNIINDQWYSSKKENKEKEAERIITIAAKLILGHIRSVKYDCGHYPTSADIDNSNKGKS